MNRSSIYFRLRLIPLTCVYCAFIQRSRRTQNWIINSQKKSLVCFGYKMRQLLWYYAKVLAKTKNDNTNLETQLSNDPGKKGSNFFCCDAIRFPYIKMFSFLRREYINLQKDCLRKKMYLNSTFKESIFLSKHFDQSQELQTMAKKCSQFT